MLAGQHRWVRVLGFAMLVGLLIVPAGRKHGFSNNGATTLHIRSTLAAPVFEAAYDDKRETPRRWLPGAGA